MSGGDYTQYKHDWIYILPVTYFGVTAGDVEGVEVALVPFARVVELLLRRIFLEVLWSKDNATLSELYLFL